MSTMLYRFFYGLGAAPWERLAELPCGRQLVVMLEHEEAGHQPPFGRALDLGCGTGGWSVRLASRGWQVTGVDIVPRAIRAARERAREAAVDVQFVRSDVADLQSADVGSGYRLVLDIGTVHGLPAAKRAAVGQAVTAVTEPGAVLVMYAFTPARRGPLPHGLSRADIAATYPGWQITDEVAFDPRGLPESTLKDDPRWYRLIRGRDA